MALVCSAVEVGSGEPDAAWSRRERTKRKKRQRNDVGIHRHAHVRTRDESQTPINGLGGSLEPAAPTPIAATTENQQYDENDQKRRRVHVALLWTGASSPSSLHIIFRWQGLEWIVSESTQVAMSCVAPLPS
jgi:hypothetical protein